MRKDRSPFRLFPKVLACGTTVYYYTTYDSTGRRRQFSTGEKNERAAEKVALERFRAGRLVPSDPCLFKTWTRDWFDEGRCPYLDGRRLRGFSTSPVHAKNRRSLLVRYLWPSFGEQVIGEIRAGHIETALRRLLDAGKSRDLANRCLETLQLILDEAVRLELIASNPARKVLKFSHREKEKGILTEKELERLFDPLARSLVWRGREVAYWALVTCRWGGLRQGEVLGLQKEDLGRDGILVSHGWDRIGGLKGTKTGRSRFVPLPLEVISALERLTPGGHVFSLTNGERPVSPTYLRKAFVDALETIGVPRQEQVSRNLGTHSLRHGLVSHLLAEGTPVGAVAQLVGHQTLSLTVGRYHHQTPVHIQEIRRRQG